MSVHVYLAGPEVFLPNVREIGARKRAICERHGLVGVFSAEEEKACDQLCPSRSGVSPSAARWSG
jgi:nucleoside 2-deoxyribosyltransferase